MSVSPWMEHIQWARHLLAPVSAAGSHLHLPESLLPPHIPTSGGFLSLLTSFTNFISHSPHLSLCRTSGPRHPRTESNTPVFPAADIGWGCFSNEHGSPWPRYVVSSFPVRPIALGIQIQRQTHETPLSRCRQWRQVAAVVFLAKKKAKSAVLDLLLRRYSSRRCLSLSHGLTGDAIGWSLKVEALELAADSYSLGLGFDGSQVRKKGSVRIVCSFTSLPRWQNQSLVFRFHNLSSKFDKSTPIIYNFCNLNP